MKTQTILLAVGISLAAHLEGAGAVATNATFTRITTGAIVTDSSYSLGCAWGDYDNDGFDDLVVGNALGDANAFYHNNGDGTFRRVTTNAIATTVGDTDGVVWGDYDNDGWLDLFAVDGSRTFLRFRNNGDGTFTKESGGGVENNGRRTSGGAVWVDYDNDGFLDLFLTCSRMALRDSAGVAQCGGESDSHGGGASGVDGVGNGCLRRSFHADTQRQAGRALYNGALVESDSLDNADKLCGDQLVDPGHRPRRSLGTDAILPRQGGGLTEAA